MLLQGEALLNDDVSDDGFLNGALKILQPRDGHRAGHDAVLLAAAVGASAEGVLVDLGAGVGVAGLAAAHRSPALHVILVEIDPASASLATENARRNGLDSRARVLRLDIELKAAARAEAGLATESADIVILNPPFYAPGRERASPQAERKLAHHEGAGGLDAWLDAAVATARQGGRLVIIHRPQALPRLLAGLEGRVGDLSIRPIHADLSRPAVRIVISGRRASRAPLTLHSPLDLSGGEAAAILSGRSDLILS